MQGNNNGCSSGDGSGGGDSDLIRTNFGIGGTARSHAMGEGQSGGANSCQQGGNNNNNPPSSTPKPPKTEQQQQSCQQWKKANKGLMQLAALQGVGCIVPGGQAFCVSGIVTALGDALIVDPLTDMACGD